MAAHTVFATVSGSVKLLLKANRKKVKTACWIAACCTGKGQCLFTLQVSETPVIRIVWRRQRQNSYGDERIVYHVSLLL